MNERDDGKWAADEAERIALGGKRYKFDNNQFADFMMYLFHRRLSPIVALNRPITGAMKIKALPQGLFIRDMEDKLARAILDDVEIGGKTSFTRSVPGEVFVSITDQEMDILGQDISSQVELGNVDVVRRASEVYSALRAQYSQNAEQT